MNDLERGQRVHLRHTDDPAHRQLVGRTGTVTRVLGPDLVQVEFGKALVIVTDQDDVEVVG